MPLDALNWEKIHQIHKVNHGRKKCLHEKVRLYL